MPRPLRIEFPGACYQVVNRGNRREPIFGDDTDRQRFLETLGEACAKTGWRVHAWCLLPDHFHLIVETPEANLVSGMKWFLGTYTIRFNHRYQQSGHLFAGRYRAVLVCAEHGYFRNACEYVHFNPVRARLIAAEQPLRDYRWSSFAEYLKPPEERVGWLRVERLLGELNLRTDSAEARAEFERSSEARRTLSTDAWNGLRRGWCFGDQPFRNTLLARLSQRGQPMPDVESRRACALEQAEKIVGQELQRRGWREDDLPIRRKGDAEKLAIAARLRSETTVTLKWVAARLHMGAWTRLASLLYGQEPRPAATPRRIARPRRSAARKAPPVRHEPVLATDPRKSTPAPASTPTMPATPSLLEELPTHCL